MEKILEQTAAPKEEKTDDKKIEYNGQLIFHKDKTIGSVITNTIGKISSVLTSAFLLDFKGALKRFSAERKDAIESLIRERFGNLHLREDVHIGLGRAVKSESLKARSEKKNEKPGLRERIATKFGDLILNLTQGDCYSPGTQSINLFKANTGIVFHEMGHMILDNTKENLDLEETSSRMTNKKLKGIIPITQEEGLACNIACRFMTPEERKENAGLLETGYGTYQGGIFGSLASVPAFIGALASGLGPLASTQISMLIEGAGAILGAWYRKFASLFHKDASKKNYFYDQDKDKNPYWDGSIQKTSKEIPAQ